MSHSSLDHLTMTSNPYILSLLSKRHSQRGISLVELMIAMTLALFLLIGLYLIFDSTRQIYAAQSGLVQLQERQRAAISLMSGIIQSAGYLPTPPRAPKIEPYIPVASGAIPADNDTLAVIRSAVFTAATPYSAGASVYGTSGAIQVRYQTAGGSSIPNCQGDTNTTTAAIVYDNAFSLNASNQLVCAVNGGTATPLVDGVSGMSVLYGIDNNGTGTGSSSQYVTSASVGDWSTVHSVKITFTFVNPNASAAGQPATVSTTQIIQLLGNS